MIFHSSRLSQTCHRQHSQRELLQDQADQQKFAIETSYIYLPRSKSLSAIKIKIHLPVLRQEAALIGDVKPVCKTNNRHCLKDINVQLMGEDSNTVPNIRPSYIVDEEDIKTMACLSLLQGKLRAYHPSSILTPLTLPSSKHTCCRGNEQEDFPAAV